MGYRDWVGLTRIKLRSFGMGFDMRQCMILVWRGEVGLGGG